MAGHPIWAVQTVHWEHSARTTRGRLRWCSGLAAVSVDLRVRGWLHVTVVAVVHRLGDVPPAENGLSGPAQGYASNAAGIRYTALTLRIVDTTLGGGVLGFSVVVGGFMFLVSSHEFVPALPFTPGDFFAYATMFSVRAAEATALGPGALPGQTVAVGVSLRRGAAIGLPTDQRSTMLAD